MLAKMHHWWLKCTDFFLYPSHQLVKHVCRNSFTITISTFPKSENVTYAFPMKRSGQTSLTAPVGRLFFSRRPSRPQVGGVWSTDSSSELIPANSHLNGGIWLPRFIFLSIWTWKPDDFSKCGSKAKKKRKFATTFVFASLAVNFNQTAAIGSVLRLSWKSGWLTRWKWTAEHARG